MDRFLFVKTGKKAKTTNRVRNNHKIKPIDRREEKLRGQKQDKEMFLKNLPLILPNNFSLF